MNQKLENPEYLELAREHGIDASAIEPPDHQHRLQKLRNVLDRKDVPFPISDAVASRYFELARSGIPFGVGSLTEKSVDLQGFENEQIYDDLTQEDHLSWACLVADQQEQKHQYACREYLQGEREFEIRGTTIPDYYILNARIYQQTGWQLATVSEIIPAHVFFHCHSRRFFPVTTFMRPPGTGYLEEPDIGHDIAGHVATFTIPQVALVMNNHGLANDTIHREKEEKLAQATSPGQRQAIEDEATELLLYAGRLYWFTVEFGLVLQNEQLKVFGAGILSSPGETRHSVDSPEANRVIIDPSDDRDLLRLATTDYLISEYQKTYFVLKDFDSLVSLTPERIVDVVKTAIRLPHHTWREIVPGDRVLNAGRCVTGPNEKYLGLLAGRSVDECLQRVAERNLGMLCSELDIRSQQEQVFINNMSPVPSWVLAQWSNINNGEESMSESATTNYPVNTGTPPELSLEAMIKELERFDHDIPLAALKELMGRLEVDVQDLATYLQFSEDAYQRNLVACNGQFEALLLCFEAGQRTPIHDHAGSACGVKVLEGVATETIFEPTKDGWLYATESSHLNAGGVVGSVDMDIHQLSNLQSDSQRLVTLHIYSPPLGEVGNYSITDNSVIQVKAATRRN